MDIHVSDDKQQLGRAAAEAGVNLIRRAIDERGQANLIVATGASQFEMLEALGEYDLPWHKVTAFHLDEYVGMPITHPASFRLYLWQRFQQRLAVPMKQFHYLDAEEDGEAEARRVGRIIEQHPIDVAFVGIGENGHLAFNDPPADFETDSPYLIVNLDRACREQQMGEGWFQTLEDVPKQAISMSCKQILKSRSIIVSIPDERKAQAVQGSVEGPVTPDVPASILQQHEQTTLYLDRDSASKLSTTTV